MTRGHIMTLVGLHVLRDWQRRIEPGAGLDWVINNVEKALLGARVISVCGDVEEWMGGDYGVGPGSARFLVQIVGVDVRYIIGAWPAHGVMRAPERRRPTPGKLWVEAKLVMPAPPGVASWDPGREEFRAKASRLARLWVDGATIAVAEEIFTASAPTAAALAAETLKAIALRASNTTQSWWSFASYLSLEATRTGEPMSHLPRFTLPTIPLRGPLYTLEMFANEFATATDGLVVGRLDPLPFAGSEPRVYELYVEPRGRPAAKVLLLRIEQIDDDHIDVTGWSHEETRLDESTVDAYLRELGGSDDVREVVQRLMVMARPPRSRR